MKLIKALSSRAPAPIYSGNRAPVIFAAIAWFLIQGMGLESHIWWSVVSGAVGGVLIGLITEYYTGSAPVRRIAKSGETGPATVMITGLAVGMQSVVLPVLILAGIIFLSTHLAGLYGVGIAAVGILATVGITMAIDGSMAISSTVQPSRFTRAAWPAMTPSSASGATKVWVMPLARATGMSSLEGWIAVAACRWGLYIPISA